MWRVILLGALVAGACGKGAPKADKTSTGSAAASAGSGAAPKRDDVAKRAHDEAVRVSGAGLMPADALQIESGKIVFDDRRVEEATETVWFADHGATVVVQRQRRQPSPETFMTVWRDGKNATWVVDKDPRRVLVTRLRSKSTELAAPQQLEMAGYTRGADEVVAGVTAEVWSHEQMKIKLWVWKGIQVKSEVTMRQTHTVTATSIEEGVKPPPELLEYPEGYEVKDMTK